MLKSLALALVLSLGAWLWLNRAPSSAAPAVASQSASVPASITTAEPVAAIAAARSESVPRAALTLGAPSSKPTTQQTIDAIASERDLLDDGVWRDVQRTMRLAATEEGFNKLLQILATSSSVEISQRQATYLNLFVTDPLYLSGDLQIGQVTCGESVCAAFVSGRDPQQLSAFVGRLRRSPDPPIYSLTALDVPVSASRAGKRLIFSINLVRDSTFSIRTRSR